MFNLENFIFNNKNPSINLGITKNIPRFANTFVNDKYYFYTLLIIFNHLRK